MPDSEQSSQLEPRTSTGPDPYLLYQIAVCSPVFQYEMALLATDDERQHLQRAAQRMLGCEPPLLKEPPSEEPVNNTLLLLLSIDKSPRFGNDDRQKFRWGCFLMQQRCQISSDVFNAIAGMTGVEEKLRAFEEVVESSKARRKIWVQLFCDLCHHLPSLSDKQVKEIDEALAEYEQYLCSCLDFLGESYLHDTGIDIPIVIGEKARLLVVRALAVYGVFPMNPDEEGN